MSDLPRDVATSRSLLDLHASARDLWPRDTLAVRDHDELPTPDAVLWPQSDEEVLSCLEAAARAGRVVVPWGAGSGVCGGARGRAGAWMLDLKRFDRIDPVDEATWSVEAGAGVNGQRLEDHLQAQGWAMSHSPSSIGCSTVGGWLAARGAGQFSSAYGVFEDMVLGVDGVAPGLGRFHAGLAGSRSHGRRIDEAELDALIGSEGTLGIITRVRMRVRPLPTLRVLRGWRFPSVASATEAMRELMQGETWPFVLRLYDPVDTWIGGKTRPKKHRDPGQVAWYKQLVADLEARHPEVVRHELAMPLSLPRMLNRVAGTLSGGCLLVVGWEGPRDVVAAMERSARPILAREGLDLGPGPGERWYASRHAVSYKLMPILLRGGFVDTMEVAAPWSVIPDLWARVRQAVAPYALVMAHFSHGYAEGGTIYFSFAGRGDVATYDAAWRAAQGAVASVGAAVSHHHGIGVLKRRWASRAVGPAVRGWQDLKASWDPAGVLNPGVLFEPVPERTDVPAAPRTTHDDALCMLGAEDRPDAMSGVDVRWAWDRLPGPPRWARNAWESGWIGVTATVDGQRVVLGRGPREAVGPDLRRWVWRHGQDLPATVGVAPHGPRWMGRVRVAHPWSVVRDLLRGGLRPGAVGAVDGWLYLGFRGPAAAELGAIAAARIDAVLEPVPWRTVSRFAGPVVPCAPDDPRAVSATEQHVWRAEEGTDA